MAIITKIVSTSGPHLHTLFWVLTQHLDVSMASILTSILASILTSILAYYLASLQAFILAFYLASILTSSLTWALPDLNRERQISLGSAH